MAVRKRPRASGWLVTASFSIRSSRRLMKGTGSHARGY